MIKLLYKQLDKIDGLSKDKLRKVYQLYPKVKILLELFMSLKASYIV
ncbi:hypothetical protein CLOSPI_01472 [Thomasclavelia spiroformis DSM 1552]|uniref:Uncharacterized protein n=1 Tax=Thomasclavelia spiroformis DSM 1552 TaxID=428126 RepID=B1C2L0_9FIRM|nr:hypothetical protein CLOSPI_01472 [Thomasclavelia spiroformis DSM 1552]